MSHDIFVSHSSRDKFAADAIVAHLERGGLRCWVAPRDILPGESWAKSILRAIEGSRALVIVFSKNANESSHIRREVERAVSNGIPIVPVRIEDTPPVDDLEYFLSTCHWMDAITPPLEAHFTALAQTLRLLLKISQPASTPEVLPSHLQDVTPPQTIAPQAAIVGIKGESTAVAVSNPRSLPKWFWNPETSTPETRPIAWSRRITYSFILLLALPPLFLSALLLCDEITSHDTLVHMNRDDLPIIIAIAVLSTITTVSTAASLWKTRWGDISTAAATTLFALATSTTITSALLYGTGNPYIDHEERGAAIIYLGGTAINLMAALPCLMCLWQVTIAHDPSLGVIKTAWSLPFRTKPRWNMWAVRLVLLTTLTPIVLAIMDYPIVYIRRSISLLSQAGPIIPGSWIVSTGTTPSRPVFDDDIRDIFGNDCHWTFSRDGRLRCGPLRNGTYFKPYGGNSYRWKLLKDTLILSNPVSGVVRYSFSIEGPLTGNSLRLTNHEDSQHTFTLKRTERIPYGFE